MRKTCSLNLQQNARSGLVRPQLSWEAFTCPLASSNPPRFFASDLSLSVGLAEPALAQTANIEGVLQNIVTMLTGNVARLLATLAVIIVGIAWMFGYLDLRKAAYVVLGVAITFGASEVVSTLTGGR